MKRFLPIAIGVACVGVLLIVVSQYRTRQSPPVVSGVVPVASSEPSPVAGSSASLQSFTLAIGSPADGSTVSSSSVIVKGRTSAGAEVFVNDSEVRADANGNFSVKLTLEEGDNYILVVANDASGNYTEKELTITYTP